MNSLTRTKEINLKRDRKYRILTKNQFVPIITDRECHTIAQNRSPDSVLTTVRRIGIALYRSTGESLFTKPFLDSRWLDYGTFAFIPARNASE
jgi:hypothetical protein